MNHQRARILWIFIASILKNGDAMQLYDAEDKSICKKYHRVTEKRRVPYEESYDADYGWQRVRTNYREEEFTKWVVMEMCCDGYEPHRQDDEAATCVPVCLSDCLYGECVRPNQCTCHPGYRNVTNELTEYNECVPVCTSGCQGGTCVKPDECECGMGYLQTKDRSSCTPICTIFGFGPQGCGHNASCVAPHMCQCNNGYIATANSSAIPDPRLTYSSSWNTEEITKDLQENHERRTFNSSDFICKPRCVPECGGNSRCVAPDQCECKAGYKEVPALEVETGFLCVPNCQQTCYNGFCVAPNKCACNEGYKSHELLNEDFCEPICHEQCVNGKCTRPDYCECFDGYEKLINSALMLGAEPHGTWKSICTPVCPGQCPNGTCISPGQCRCNIGYVLDFLTNETVTDIADVAVSRINPLNHSTRQFCRPKCNPECPTGSTCTAPNHCQSEAKSADQISRVSDMIHTRIVNFTRDCGDNAVAYEENGACGCEYQVDGEKLIEHGLCAIIFASDTEAHFEIERIYVGNVSDASFNTTDWMFRRSECRTLILSKEMEDAVAKNTEHCYLLVLHGLPSFARLETAAKQPHESENENIICLSTLAETMCGLVDSNRDNGQVGLTLVIIGTIALITLVVGVAAAIYLARRKIRKTGIFGTDSRSNSNIME